MNHHATMVDQFTRQAHSFATAPAMNDAAAMDLLLRAVAPSAADTVLDVACGPGITAAALAARVAHVDGVDATWKMVDLAEQRCGQAGLTNTSFRRADVNTLPFEDGSFSLVVCRYSMHHFLDPARVVAEMARVCTRGGRIAVVDVAANPDPAVAQRFDEVEQARDPSHVRALTSGELTSLMADAGLQARTAAHYAIPVDLDALLARSASPNPEAVRALFRAAIGGKPLGVGERKDRDGIHFEFPINVYLGHCA